MTELEQKYNDLKAKHDQLLSRVSHWNISLTRSLVELKDSPVSFRSGIIGLSFAMDDVVTDIDPNFSYRKGSVMEEWKEKLLEEWHK